MTVYRKRDTSLLHFPEPREPTETETISESTLIKDEAVLVWTFILLPVSRVKIGLFFQNICLMASLVIFKSHLLRDVIFNDNMQWPIVFRIFQDALLLTVFTLILISIVLVYYCIVLFTSWITSPIKVITHLSSKHRLIWGLIYVCSTNGWGQTVCQHLILKLWGLFKCTTCNRAIPKDHNWFRLRHRGFIPTEII